MVRSGIMRAFGSELWHVLSTALRNRFLALLAGMGVTAVLQSSTATGLLMTSFAARGLVDLVPALAVMLWRQCRHDIDRSGAVIRHLGGCTGPVSGSLLAFKLAGRTTTRDLGRVAIGLGLMLRSLHILLDTLAPAENASSVRALLSAIAREPVLCVLMAAALTWAAHSSAAVVLLVMSLAYSHFVVPAAALALVLGANLGMQSTHCWKAAAPAARRAAVFRLVTSSTVSSASGWHCLSCNRSLISLRASI